MQGLADFLNGVIAALEHGLSVLYDEVAYPVFRMFAGLLVDNLGEVFRGDEQFPGVELDTSLERVVLADLD